MIKRISKLSIATLLIGSMCAVSLNANETIANLYIKKNELTGKTVTVKGTVLKITRAIMKKDWITISDGTISHGKDSVIFTSTSKTAKLISIGDKVIATGVLELDLDLGFPGYQYPVIVQNSKFRKQ